MTGLLNPIAVCRVIDVGEIVLPRNPAFQSDRYQHTS
jgi:hypothetical protein